MAEELRLARVAQRDAHVGAVRADHEARAATDESTATRHRQLAGIWGALEAKAQSEADMFTAVQESRIAWEAATEVTRGMAIAANLELRRRHPARKIRPLRPHPAEALSITPGKPGSEGAWSQSALFDTAEPSAPEARRNAAPGTSMVQPAMAALGLTPEMAHAEIPEAVHQSREQARISNKLLQQCEQDPAVGRGNGNWLPGPGWPNWRRSGSVPILQPPQPEISPAPQLLNVHRASLDNEDYSRSRFVAHS